MSNDHKWIVVTNPPEARKMKSNSNDSNTQPAFNWKRGVGNLGIVLAATGGALLVRGGLNYGVEQGRVSDRTANIVQTGLGVVASGALGAMDHPRAAAAVGAGNLALGGNGLVEDVRLWWNTRAQASASPTPSTSTAAGLPGAVPGGRRVQSYGPQRAAVAYRG